MEGSLACTETEFLLTYQVILGTGHWAQDRTGQDRIGQGRAGQGSKTGQDGAGKGRPKSLR